MKKLFMLLALVLGVVSCQTEPEGFDVVVGGEQDVNITVSLPESTRAASNQGFDFTDFVNNSDYDLRFILEIRHNGEVVRDIKTSETTSATFPVRLAPDRVYTFTVWADLVKEDSEDDLFYDTTTLSNITLKTDVDENIRDIVELRDAYTYTDTFEFSGENREKLNMTLTRPFAKVRVVATDLDKVTDFGINPAKGVVEYSEVYTAFNAVEGNVNGGATSNKTSGYSIVRNNYTEENGQLTVFADYIFVPTTENTQPTVTFTLDVQDADSKPIKKSSFNTAIPVSRNKVTSIVGDVLTQGENIDVDINTGFDGNTTKYTGTINETIELTEGQYIFDNLTVNTTSENAVVIAEDKNVTIDIIGDVTLKSAGDAILVPATATLTINGVVAQTRSAERAGKLVVEATDGSAISGSVTINNLAGLTAKGNGDHAFGIGGTNAEVTINNTKVEYVAGGHIQPLFVNDEKYGKSEPEGGAAIGGQMIKIKNSTITKAEGGSKAAAIGNSYWNSTEVVINNSQLGDIFGGNASAAIGGSRYSSDISADNKQVAKVKIENSTITNAVGGQFGAGIGSGYDTHCAANNTNAVNEIVIINSAITAQGGKYAAGIGTGFHVAALSGSIDAASTINATAGAGFYKDTYTYAQNIGYGIVDPTREFANGVVTFTVANEKIEKPKMAVADGVAANGNEYAIYNGNGLKWFAEQVSGTNSFAGKSVVMIDDIDLKGEEWKPIGMGGKHFEGTFDGQGHTIKGLKVTARNSASQAALFCSAAGKAQFKNFTIDEAYVKYPADNDDYYAAAVVGTVYGSLKFEDITVKNSTITGNNKVGAIFAHDGSSNKITINNCHVDNCYIASEDTADGGNVGGLIGLFQTGSDEACKISNSSVKNSTIVGINSTNNGKRANSEFIGGILTKTNTNLVLENCVVENNTFSQTIDGTAAVTYVGAFPAQFIGGDRGEKLLGFVMINGVPVSAAGYEKLANYPNIFVKEGNYYVFGIAGLEDLNNYFNANWCSNNTWTPEYNIAADIDATGFTWDGVYLNVGWNGNNGIVLNGNGHTISNLTINNYLLSGTPCGGNDGVRPGLVKDITMKNVTVNGSSHDAAIFWGSCYTNVDFENVTVDGAKITGGSNVGALVSRTSIEDPNTEIKVNFKNCVVKNSTLEANNTNADPNGASGFIGRTYGNTKLTFEGCSVENNTIKNANGLVGGAVYGYTTWAGNGFYGTGACDTFTNWNGLVIETVTTEETLKTALNAGKNVILGADIEIDSTIKVANDQTVTIDLNGHNITSKIAGKPSGFELFSINGKLEIKGNGTISLKSEDFEWNTSYRYTAINIRETGVVTLGKGVSVICEASKDGRYGMSYAVDIYKTGTLNINGASLHSNYIAVRCFYGNSVVNVNSGSKITSSKNNYGIWLQSSPGAVVTIADDVNHTFDNDIYYFN